MSLHEATASVSQLPLTGRTAVVTGASKGIGAAVARRFDAAGARVVLVGRTRGTLEELAGDLDHDPAVAVADLATSEGPVALWKELTGQAGRIDILVNNAGAGQLLPTHLLPAEQLDALLATNIRSVLVLGAQAAAHMADAGGGAVINISSAVAQLGTNAGGAYSASKGAVDAFTRALAAEWSSQGVRVNAVAPGAVNTPLLQGVLQAIPTFEPLYNDSTPAGRFGTPEEIAEVVAFLASDAASYITGQVITADGGWGATKAFVPAA